MIILLTSAYNFLESLTGNYSLIWSGLSFIVVLLSSVLRQLSHAYMIISLHALYYITLLYNHVTSRGFTL